ncbi:hypothetical protein [Anaeromyxobacter oryzae]|uniref:Lipoprotein n=1 Tax=Anaeromyxobacter oryzae TaxID=2918170 RepID=A0ABN6N138_9BACT|nr:hypothetical protein [Anaeromyxobacter oryzae]BDG05655.1 hypothetical protein AMOR_46510 [Anaeromyxobacter oryzae]
MSALRRHVAVRALAGVFLLALAATACRRGGDGPRELLDRYFSTAVRQDYSATWECYDQNYRSKVDRDEYVQHRRDASQLVTWKVVSLEEHGDTARAQVDLVFAPSPRLGRPDPAEKKVVEDLVRERGEWRVKVW